MCVCFGTIQKPHPKCRWPVVWPSSHHWTDNHHLQDWQCGYIQRKAKSSQGDGSDFMPATDVGGYLPLGAGTFHPPLIETSQILNSSKNRWRARSHRMPPLDSSFSKQRGLCAANQQLVCYHYQSSNGGGTCSRHTNVSPPYSIDQPTVVGR